MNRNKGLSEDEKIILQKHKELEVLSKSDTERFWNKEYKNYLRTEKENYWLASVHRGMRDQGESTGDPYSEFSLEWYEWAKSVESEFDEIFKSITTRLGFEFDWNKYRVRIHS